MYTLTVYIDTKIVVLQPEDCLLVLRKGKNYSQFCLDPTHQAGETATNDNAVNGEYSTPFSTSSIQPRGSQQSLLQVNKFQWEDDFAVSLMFENGSPDKVDCSHGSALVSLPQFSQILTYANFWCCAINRDYHAVMRCRLPLGKRLHAIRTFFQNPNQPSNHFSRILWPRKILCLCVMCPIIFVHACPCAVQTPTSQFILTDHGTLESPIMRLSQRTRYVGSLLYVDDLRDD